MSIPHIIILSNVLMILFCVVGMLSTGSRWEITPPSGRQFAIGWLATIVVLLGVLR